MTPSAGYELVVVANRLPVDRVSAPDGSVTWQRSPGGLVTALAPVMRTRGGVWVGWSGSADDDADPTTVAPDAGPTVQPCSREGIDMLAVPLTSRDVVEFYEGFSNATLWPLYHDVIVPPEYHEEWWESYVRVNRRFAEAAAGAAAPGATVWVHDYQLQLVPAMLRTARPDLRIGFFLHIPFPPVELYTQLPWRTQLLDGLLGADLAGFQTPGAVSNFVRLCERLLALRTTGAAVHANDGREVLAGVYPISIDAEEVDHLARSEETARVAAQIRTRLGSPPHVLLGVDRLDYTKGIRHRIKAFGELVADGALSPGSAVFVQLATPSRERVEGYRALRDELDLLVGRLNGQYGEIGYPPVQYLHTSQTREELVALFRAADIMVVTPLRDGMNLVAKEYVASRYDDTGVLVLSEFAGAAYELTDALLVNPHDVGAMKAAMLEAIAMPAAEQRRRMSRMRERVFDHDVRRWAGDFLSELGARG